MGVSIGPWPRTLARSRTTAHGSTTRRRLGDGPAAMLTHAGVANLRMWDDQVAALRDAYRVIRVRHPRLSDGHRDRCGRVLEPGRHRGAARPPRRARRPTSSACRAAGANTPSTSRIEYPEPRADAHRGRRGAGSAATSPPTRRPADTSRGRAETLMRTAKDWAALSEWEAAYLGRRTRPAARPRPRGARAGPRLGPGQLPAPRRRRASRSRSTRRRRAAAGRPDARPCS